MAHCAGLNIHETRGDFLSAEFVANGGSVVGYYILTFQLAHNELN